MSYVYTCMYMYKGCHIVHLQTMTKVAPIDPYCNSDPLAARRSQTYSPLAPTNSVTFNVLFSTLKEALMSRAVQEGDG